jgi:hypothetical protein
MADVERMLYGSPSMVPLDVYFEAVALPWFQFPTRGRDRGEIVFKGEGATRTEPFPSALWSSHECLCRRQELPDNA